MSDDSSKKAVPDSLQSVVNTPNLYNVSTLAYAFVTVITLVAILFFIHGSLSYQQYLDSRKGLADNLVNITSNEIKRFIEYENKHLLYFSKEHIDLIEKVVTASDSNLSNKLALENSINKYFPNMSNFNILDSNGDLLIPGLNDLVYELCVNDILDFLRSSQATNFSIHLDINHYHYDLMVSMLLGDKEVVLFISQPLDDILNILGHYKIQGLSLELFEQASDNLVEVNEYMVNAQDDDAIILQQKDQKEEYASHWKIRAYTDGHVDNIFKLSLIKQLVIYYLGFLLLMILFFVYILRLNNTRVKLFKKIEQQEESCNDQRSNLPLPYESIDPDFNIRVVNPAWCEMLGYEQDEVIGQPISNFLFQDSMEKLQALFPNYVLDGGINHDAYSIKHKNGSRVDVELFSRFEYGLNGEFLYTNSILTNLTQKRQANEHINSLEQRDSMHWRQTMVGIIEWDNDLRVIDWNPAAEMIFGFNKAEVLGLKAKDFMQPDAARNSVEQICQDLLAEEGSEHEISQNLTKDKQLITCEWFNTVIFDDSRKVIGVSSLVMDITLHAESLEIVKQHKRELNQLIDSMVEAVITIDETGVILSFNLSAEKIFGYDADDAIGKSIKLLIPELNKSQHDQYLANYLTSATSKSIGPGYEVEGKRKNGDIFPLRMSISELPQTSSNVRRFVGSCIDISEHRKMEEAIRQSRKLDAIGEMAGGIAHDFNNLLGIISGNLEILKRYSGDNADMNKWIDSGLRTTERGTTLTKSLLGFSRVDAGEVKTVSLSHQLTNMTSMIEKTAGLKVKVNYKLADELWLTDIDSGDFEDAIINLVINAKDAMQADGNIEILAYNEVLSENKASYLLGCKAGDYVVLCVSDSGSGMSKEVQQRIFDPFYSTKDKDKGTGLGLSMVHGFIRRSHGSIDVRSELGVGTAFYLYLPRSVNNKLESFGDEMKEVVPVGTETILVVDDEPQLVDVASIYLSDLGYKVLQATDTEQAMAFLQGDEKIDMMFSDIIMPGGKDGYELSEDALALRPAMKVLLVSGYTPENDTLSTDARHLAAMRLSKPYGRAELAQRIRLVLDEEDK